MSKPQVVHCKLIDIIPGEAIGYFDTLDVILLESKTHLNRNIQTYLVSMDAIKKYPNDSTACDFWFPYVDCLDVDVFNN